MVDARDTLEVAATAHKLAHKADGQVLKVMVAAATNQKVDAASAGADNNTVAAVTLRLLSPTA